MHDVLLYTDSLPNYSSIALGEGQPTRVPPLRLIYTHPGELHTLILL